MRQCGVPDCLRPLHYKAYCQLHGQRLKLTGTTDAAPRARSHAAISRLWAELHTLQGPGPCVPWPGACDKRTGYGLTKRHGENIATRAVWIELCGPIPDGLLACHHCDNPPCVRPSHLFLGDAAANSADMWSKGRARPPRDLENGRTKVSPETVRELLRRADDGEMLKTLAAEYGLHASHVGRIVSGQRRTHLTAGAA